MIPKELLARSRERLGIERPFRHQWNTVASFDNLRQFAWGVADDNRLWSDHEYGLNTRWESAVAHPMFFESCTVGLLIPSPDGSTRSKGQGLPGLQGISVGRQIRFYKPIRLDTRVRGTVTIVGVVDPTNRIDGDLVDSRADIDTSWRAVKQEAAFPDHPMVDEILLRRAYDAESGELLAETIHHLWRLERAGGLTGSKYESVGWPKYTESDWEEIMSAYGDDYLRGQEVLDWDEVPEGLALPKRVHGPLTVVGMIGFMMGYGSPFTMSDKFFYQFVHNHPGSYIPDPVTSVPIVNEDFHWNDFMANSIGMPRGIDLALQRKSWFASLVGRWAGDDSMIHELDVWLTRPLFLHDCCWITGRVARKYREGPKKMLEISLEAQNQDGTSVAFGRASVELLGLPEKPQSAGRLS